MKALLLFSLCLNCVCGLAMVTIKQGELRGTQFISRGGREFTSYLGIPYAKAPTGELRFQSPQAHPGWEGILDATKEGPMCPQYLTLIPSVSGVPMGEEDCLYLNVHVPAHQNNITGSSKKLPVMVWIYGGAFQMGDSGSATYGPNYLMDRDVVYVNFNYRLGVLGFLSFQTTSVPGNFGLKDQNLALQWVRHNIEAFGGDSDSITIFGESAGAASVHFQLLAPKSKGLFHKAIMQSGSTYCPWALVPQHIIRDRATAFSVLLGCHGNEEDQVTCLRKVPVDLILATQLKFVEWGIDPIIGFAPTIEPEHSGALISKHPLEYQTSTDIPLIIGLNQDEGAMRAARLCANGFLEMNQLNDRWERYMPLAVMLRDSVKNLSSVVESVTQYYLQGKRVDESNIRSLIDMFSDLLINHGVIKTANNYAGPVYFYVYNYEAEISWTSVFGDCPLRLGVSHADEMVNLFNLDSLFKGHKLQGNDLKMSNTMLSLWTNFANSGVPRDDSGNIQWPQYNNRRQYVHMGQNDTAILAQPLDERYQYVDSLPLELTALELQLSSMNKMADQKNEL